MKLLRNMIKQVPGFPLFTALSIQRAHKELWSQQQADNNPEAVDLAQRKIVFISTKGNKEHYARLQKIISDAEELTNHIYMLPIETDEMTWKALQEEHIARLDKLVNDVSIYAGKKF